MGRYTTFRPCNSAPYCSKQHLLCLLDGLATGVRRCVQRTYTLHVRVPCSSPAATMSQVHAAAPAAPGTPAAAGAAPYAAGLPHPGMPPSGAGWLPGLPPQHHVASLTLPQLRQQDIQGALFHEAELGSWHDMGSTDLGS